MNTKKICLIAMATVLLILLSFLPAFSQTVEPDTSQTAEFQRFNTGRGYSIYWDKKTGVPRAIYGVRLNNAYRVRGTGSNNVQAAARMFLNEQRKIFRMKENLADLEVKRIRSVKGISHIRFQQTFKKIPVATSEYFVHIKEDVNAVIMANGRYFPDINLSNTRNDNTTPAVTSQGAAGFARSDVNLENVELELMESELVVLPVENEYFLAWEVTIAAKDIPSSWRIHIGASQGNILKKQNLIMDINGTGRVYLTDGGSSYSTVTLYRLSGSGHYLSGTYAQSFNDAVYGSNAYNENRQFIYAPTNDHFNETNAYYHADIFEHYFAGLGFDPLSSIDLHVNVPNFDNAGYDDATRKIYFGTGGTLFRDTAKDRDVIYHEYMHAISDDIGLEFDEEEDQGQSAAMHEAYSDYFAASFTDDVTIGTWVTKTVDDLRNVNNSASLYNWSNYDDNVMDYNNETKMSNKPRYVNGMIWSGALWDLRTALGAAIADELIYGGLENAYGYATFLSGRAGIISYDQTVNSGDNVITIQNVFGNRGIGSVATPPAAPTYFANTSSVGQAPSFSWTASSGADSYKIYKKNMEVGGGSWMLAGTTTGTTYTDNSETEESHHLGIEYEYHVKAQNVVGLSSASNSVVIFLEGDGRGDPPKAAGAKLPDKFSLNQNYPNPFNPFTQINYGLPVSSTVTLRVYDVTGKLVTELVNENQNAGYHTVTWNASDFASGVYIYKMTAGNFSEIKRMILIK